MRMHVLRHVAFEDEANIGVWAVDNGHVVTRTDLYAGEEPPSLDAVDWLVVMGGPMSVWEEDAHPWLAEEKRYIRAAVEADKVVLGVCLGAQLIAEVLGGRVGKAPHAEIGWFPIRREQEAAGQPLLRCFQSPATVFHWHGDTFSIPPGADRIFSSEACPNQGFVRDGRVVGLQFHLESAPQSVERLIEHAGPGLLPGPWVQTPERMRAEPAVFLRLKSQLTSFLDTLAQECGA